MRRFGLLAVVSALVLLGGFGVASAEPPSRVADAVTDSAGVLAPGDEARITEAFGRLREADRTQLFVVYVDSFDGADGQDWADDAARLSQFGDDDVLLAVAVGDRAYGVSIAEGAAPSDSAIDSALAATEDRLAVDDWAGAAIALSDGLGGGSGGVPVAALVIGGVAAVGGGAYLVSRRRRGAAAAPEAEQPAPPRDEFTDVATDDLAYRASAGLIEVDEAVRTSEQELAAARAHFGEEAVTAFTTAVQESRSDMLRAFGIRQLLDDDVPEDEPAQRAMYADIIRACRAADERLDAQVAAFDELRNLEATAPQYLTGLAGRRDAVAAREPQVQATWAALGARYAPSALEPVAGHLDRARQLLAVAGTEITAGRAELDAARPAAAVVSGRAAEDAITQAETLLDGVARREAELADAAARIPAARAETEQDVAEAGALPDAALAPIVARARAAIAASAQAESSDPIAALRLLDDAGSALDTGIAQARAAQDRARRAAAVLEQTLLTARSSVAAAADFIGTRRGAVGAQARTRLAEAQRHLQAATSGGDVGTAQAQAQQADARAQEALRLAQSDASAWSAPSGGRGGGLGVDLGSLILGGIISGATRGGFSGSGGFGGGGFGGGRSPGSFGGSSSRGRRGGGRF
ncbi:TPM domain-containing protein [Pseudonocardia sp.]|uniref:TPM domain-containing protein n=1 Tax=Pseudonocardia sp. TaxID=60912 RepID=UPI00260D832E|nr:TPM domain-containing protein [Pseudonocardia sp.]